MTSHTNRSLFGGALLAAGLGTPALAQLNFSYTDAAAFAQEYAYFTWDREDLRAPGTFALNADISNDLAAGHGEFILTTTSARARAWVSGAGGFAYGYTSRSYFTVDQTTSALVSWDWTQSYGFLSILDLTNNTYVFSASGGNTGSTPILLDQNNEYFMRGGSLAFGEGDHSTFWEMGVPAPGSAGLLALAGLVAARRRRGGPRRG